MPACVARLTISGSAVSPAACAAASSNAIAWSTSGSPKAWAKANTRMPAIRPASIPRSKRLPTMSGTPLVAGEAEKMPAVMHELVHVHTVEKRHRALFGANEIDGDEHQQTAEDRPGQKLANRNRSRYGDGRKSRVRHVFL